MRTLFLFALAGIILFSCKKNDNNSSVTALNYLPLNIGNYWVYETYRIDSAGNETLFDSYDSTVIIRDTTIRGNLYYVLEGTAWYMGNTWQIQEILRDSSGYYVNPQGIILLAETDFSDTLYYHVSMNEGDTIYSVVYRMEKPFYTVTVPAGTFNVLNYAGIVNFNLEGVKSPRTMNSFYANQVGLILKSGFFASTNDIYESRLVRYHIQN